MPKITSSFQLKSPARNFERDGFASIEQMVAHYPAPKGFITYCEENGKRYEYDPNYNDENTGHWRELPYLTKTETDGYYAPKPSGNDTYETTSHAQSTYLAKNDAANTYLSKEQASSGYQPKLSEEQLNKISKSEEFFVAMEDATLAVYTIENGLQIVHEGETIPNNSILGYVSKPFHFISEIDFSDLHLFDDMIYIVAKRTSEGWSLHDTWYFDYEFTPDVGSAAIYEDLRSHLSWLYGSPDGEARIVAFNKNMLGAGFTYDENFSVSIFDRYANTNIVSKFLAQFNDAPNTGDLGNLGDVCIGGDIYVGDTKVNTDNNNIRKVGMLYEQRTAVATWKAKPLVGTNVAICEKIEKEQADSSYDKYVSVIPIGANETPILVALGNSYLGYLDVEGDVVTLEDWASAFSKVCYGSDKYHTYTIVILSDTEQADYLYAVKTQNQVIEELTSKVNPCPWLEYNTLTENLPNTLPTAGVNNENEWEDDGEGTITGHIDVDATKGNRIFDLRKLDSESIAEVDIDFRGVTNYETIIYYRGFDTISLVYNSPLTAEDFCFLNEEPELDDEKEYVLSIQGNTIAYGTLTRGVTSVVEVEE